MNDEGDKKPLPGKGAGPQRTGEPPVGQESLSATPSEGVTPWTDYEQLGQDPRLG